MQGDVHHIPLAPDSFDAVVSVAALHHMDAGRSLTRFAQLVRPGGTVVVVGSLPTRGRTFRWQRWRWLRATSLV